MLLAPTVLLLTGVAAVSLLLPALAYGHALWLYDRTDSVQFSLLRDLTEPPPPTCNPYDSQQPAWFFLVGLILLLAVAARVLLGDRIGFRADSRDPIQAGDE